jgi:hypothetical protein
MCLVAHSEAILEPVLEYRKFGQGRISQILGMWPWAFMGWISTFRELHLSGLAKSYERASEYDLTTDIICIVGALLSGSEMSLHPAFRTLKLLALGAVSFWLQS